MSKQNLNQMMQERSPLVEREVVEAVEMYTNPQEDTKPKKLKLREDIPQAENMTKLLRRNAEIRKRSFVENYAIENTREEKVVKYTTHLAPLLIKAVKRLSLESDMRDYEIVQAALIEYLDNLEAL